MNSTALYSKIKQLQKAKGCPGTFFSVTTANGRRYACKFSKDPIQPYEHLLLVWDAVAKGFRNIRINAIIYLRVGGEVIYQR